MPFGSGDTAMGASGGKPSNLLTIIGAACTSEKFRAMLFYHPEEIFKRYPELELATKEEKDVFKDITANRGFPNPLEVAIANVHVLLISIRHGDCTYPCFWKLDPSVEMKKP